MPLLNKITRLTGGGYGCKSIPFSFDEADKVGDTIPIAHNLGTTDLIISYKDNGNYINTSIFAFKVVDADNGYFEIPAPVTGTITGTITGIYF